MNKIEVEGKQVEIYSVDSWKYGNVDSLSVKELNNELYNKIQKDKYDRKIRGIFRQKFNALFYSPREPIRPGSPLSALWHPQVL